MPPIAPQQVQLTCPNCRTPFRTAIYTIIDAAAQPQLKQALLTGQLNVAVCPACGMGTMLGAPLIYHDRAHQLLLVHMPQELGARPEEQERFIGEATSILMRDLPGDTPRGYMLTPRRFLSLGALVDAVLEADGIPREAIEAQRRRVSLIGALVEAIDDDQRLSKLVDQHRDDLDGEFFDTLAALAQASAQSGRADSAEMLQTMRAKVAALVGFTDQFDDADLAASLDAVVDRLIEVEESELETAIGELRPEIDYSFFEALTGRIEAATQAGDSQAAARLTARRQLILETVERMDAQAQALFEAGTQVLSAVLQAPDLREALRAQSERLDEAFMLVLSANMAAAERAGNQESIQRLQQVQQTALDVIQERMTPEERLINQLLAAATPQESTRLLRQNAAQVTAAFVKRVNELAGEMDQSGRKELGQRLRQIGREASAMLF